MSRTLHRQFRVLLFLLSLGSLPAAQAQDTEGGCSITLLSDSSTRYQVWCLDPPVATIEPVVWLVQGTGIQVSNLPPGVTAVLSNDTLTISGTISAVGISAVQVSTNEGCSSPVFYMAIHPYVDPQFSCSLVGEDVVLHWPGINATLQEGGEIILLCTTTDGFVDTWTQFLPCPDSLVWPGLPTNIELTFGMTGTGDSYCFVGYYETTCMNPATGVSEQMQDGVLVRATCVDDRLELWAPMGLREARIHDPLGRLLVTHALSGTTASIPIAALAPGAFILRATGADGQVTVQRFVKE
ncbi:MAG: T9SS type A sorting domain-containing protein [Bacteroidetes bacterium]|nr:T9SS type A sorting domain-containing protein [Bacteroidota bacterium]